MLKRKEGSWVLIAPALLCIHAVLFSRFEISMDTSLFGHVLLKILSVAVLLGYISTRSCCSLSSALPELSVYSPQTISSLCDGNLLLRVYAVYSYHIIYIHLKHFLSLFLHVYSFYLCCIFFFCCPDFHRGHIYTHVQKRWTVLFVLAIASFI